jgi:hypothetical protein
MVTLLARQIVGFSDGHFLKKHPGKYSLEENRPQLCLSFISFYYLRKEYCSSTAWIGLQD